MPTVTMPVSLPDEFIDEVAAAITAKVMENISLYIKANELPPYPNRTELRSILKIGDEKINQWIKDGLPQIPWSKKETKFDRDDVKQMINSMKY
jgi:hypothetical protein